MEFTITYSYVCSANTVSISGLVSDLTYSIKPVALAHGPITMPTDSANFAACPLTKVLEYYVIDTWVSVASSTPAGVSNYDLTTHALTISTNDKTLHGSKTIFKYSVSDLDS